MAEQVKIIRGTTAQNDAFTGAEGALSYDTEKKQIRVHDGGTAGGFVVGPTATPADYVTSYSNGTTWYRRYKSGFVIQGGSVTLGRNNASASFSCPVILTTVLGAFATPGAVKAVAIAGANSGTVYVDSELPGGLVYWMVIGIAA